ncbi:hypothetical protein EKO29_18165 [Colwellia sp. Arc7-635]|jgi:hypothetical protein|uniref:hypothetical protein n=1 Tax=Colwellia sp. Arc7-635 TaxID=2497879 RepID=UPI000F8553B5|nr:hypothetical protein [Colwellia sp. Arc7-635]AZQ85750.1 hypothetical protein EKO29_18165 [Colwellia sp. Arc7-635]
MIKQLVMMVSGMVFFSACSSHNNACEDVTLASEQVQQCQSLHKQIINTKNKPIIRTELERRYQQDCIDIRYYRDDKQAGVCGNKTAVAESQKLKK